MAASDVDFPMQLPFAVWQLDVQRSISGFSLAGAGAGVEVDGDHVDGPIETLL